MLHKFNSTDGATPYDASGLINVNGILYGTTKIGGKYDLGTVFSISMTGVEQVLHSFGSSGANPDGTSPIAGLTNVNGTLYGTTSSGGKDNQGTVFSITPTGTEQVCTASRRVPMEAASGCFARRERHALRSHYTWRQKREWDRIRPDPPTVTITPLWRMLVIEHVQRALLACVGAVAVVSCSAKIRPMRCRRAVPRRRAQDAAVESQRTSLCGPVRIGLARCLAIVRTDLRYETPPDYRAVLGIAQGDLATAAASLFYGPLGPAQLHQAYNLPSASAGKGQTVGIVDAYNDPAAESDLGAYRKQFKLPACTIKNGCLQILNQNGKSSPLPPPIPIGPGRCLSTSIWCRRSARTATSSSSKRTRPNRRSWRFRKNGRGAGARQISNSYGFDECTDLPTPTRCFDPTTASDYDIPNTIITASSGDGSWLEGPSIAGRFWYRRRRWRHVALSLQQRPRLVRNRMERGREQLLEVRGQPELDPLIDRLPRQEAPECRRLSGCRSVYGRPDV